MRNTRSRTPDLEVVLQRLEMKHLHLKRRVYELECRSFLTPAEAFERIKLKKEKLAAKDAIVAYRRDLAIVS